MVLLFVGNQTEDDGDLVNRPSTNTQKRVSIGKISIIIYISMVRYWLKHLRLLVLYLTSCLSFVKWKHTHKTVEWTLENWSNVFEFMSEAWIRLLVYVWERLSHCGRKEHQLFSKQLSKEKINCVRISERHIHKDQKRKHLSACSILSTYDPLRAHISNVYTIERNTSTQRCIVWCEVSTLNSSTTGTMDQIFKSHRACVWIVNRI